MKVQFFIYADLESLLQNMRTFHNKTKNWLTTKINENTPSGYLLFTHCSFNATKDKLDCYKGKDCMERFCKDLKEYPTKIFDQQKKKMIILTYKENKSYKKQKVCHTCKKDLVLIMAVKNILKLEIIVIILGNIEKLLIVFET